ncbi:glutamine amidotransferase [Marinobacter pelagius]|uniref:glutamine amidotransferase n=1 Tax=Marinobacter sp. C7 TaxID=2951363 RepID=UPI001EF0804E|nr:glutamine amidotransferase [Marinobacter sp. C7]MCG7201260.1 glutamine amidotransferase [Marinobacter sp. C7]
MAKKRVLILKTGTTYADIRSRFGDFEDWFIRGLSPELDPEVLDLPHGDTPGNPADWDGIVVTGSPAMVSDRETWSEEAAGWLVRAVKAGIPVLGVCYGHQLLAHALGGAVGYHPEGRETGTKVVELFAEAERDVLFSALPRHFKAQLTHKQSVLSLPPGAVCLGRSDFEPHQAFRVGDCAWGVQFHPEFSAAIMRAYLEVQMPELVREGLDPEALLTDVSPAPEASSLLQRFSELVLERQA